MPLPVHLPAPDMIPSGPDIHPCLASLHGNPHKGRQEAAGIFAKRLPHVGFPVPVSLPQPSDWGYFPDGKASAPYQSGRLCIDVTCLTQSVQGRTH